MEKIYNYHITITGRVQGVGYRAFAVRTARSLGLYGYVKNTTDGSVFIEAEGSKKALDKLVTHCKIGPGWAHIEEVKFSEFPSRGLTAFTVKY